MLGDERPSAAEGEGIIPLDRVLNEGGTGDDRGGHAIDTHEEIYESPKHKGKHTLMLRNLGDHNRPGLLERKGEREQEGPIEGMKRYGLRARGKDKSPIISQ